MQTGTVTIRNRTGLHARPAYDFVAAAKGYAAAITIRDSAAEAADAVNAKSIVLLLAQGFEQGTDVTITADGTDEEQAVAGLIELIDSGFGEEA